MTTPSAAAAPTASKDGDGDGDGGEVRVRLPKDFPWAKAVAAVLVVLTAGGGLAASSAGPRKVEPPPSPPPPPYVTRPALDSVSARVDANRATTDTLRRAQAAQTTGIAWLICRDDHSKTPEDCSREAVRGIVLPNEGR